ncbi:MAG: hypothetical protein Nk1A_5710 [Endomicrobiia bacterium]|nr:MAG: hypothetical protein Nk1A_5710 [Endomicrobiia bacterium]
MKKIAVAMALVFTLGTMAPTHAIHGIGQRDEMGRAVFNSWLSGTVISVVGLSWYGLKEVGKLAEKGLNYLNKLGDNPNFQEFQEALKHAAYVPLFAFGVAFPFAVWIGITDGIKGFNP